MGALSAARLARGGARGRRRRQPRTIRAAGPRRPRPRYDRLSGGRRRRGDTSRAQRVGAPLRGRAVAEVVVRRRRRRVDPLALRDTPSASDPLKSPADAVVDARWRAFDARPVAAAACKVRSCARRVSLDDQGRGARRRRAAAVPHGAGVERAAVDGDGARGARDERPVLLRADLTPGSILPQALSQAEVSLWTCDSEQHGAAARHAHGAARSIDLVDTPLGGARRRRQPPLCRLRRRRSDVGLDHAQFARHAVPARIASSECTSRRCGRSIWTKSGRMAARADEGLVTSARPGRRSCRRASARLRRRR